MLHIISNGSRWAGQEPAAIDELCEVLGQEPLDSTFEKYGNFIYSARVGVEQQDEQGHLFWVDGDPIYPESPDAVRFAGNFRNVSHVFSIDTDEPAIIERLTSLIRANQQRPDYA